MSTCKRKSRAKNLVIVGIPEEREYTLLWDWYEILLQECIVHINYIVKICSFQISRILACLTYTCPSTSQTVIYFRPQVCLSSCRSFSHACTCTCSCSRAILYWSLAPPTYIYMYQVVMLDTNVFLGFFCVYGIHVYLSLCLFHTSLSRSDDRIEPGPVVMLRNLREDTRKEDVSCGRVD